MTKLLLAVFILATMLSMVNVVSAWPGCCSHHNGVCGCSCCDRTPLSATCAPHYPGCSATAVTQENNSSWVFMIWVIGIIGAIFLISWIAELIKKHNKKYESGLIRHYASTYTPSKEEKPPIITKSTQEQSMKKSELWWVVGLIVFFIIIVMVILLSQ